MTAIGSSMAILVASADVRVGATQRAPAGARSTAAASHRAVLDRYCVTCHNQRLKIPASNPLLLDALDPANVSGAEETWEAVVLRLRAGAMPPAGSPRPAPDTADALASWLETELDTAAAARPNPGRVAPFHRLTRTEYRNAVRDLLAIDDLPKELDIELLLPADNTVGFDTMTEALFVTPTLMEGYLAAARKISRVAVGDPSLPLLVDIYRLGLELPQDDHFAELPLGTRGGLAIRRHFPLDGEYVIEIDLAGNAREPHQLEVSVDGERVKLFTIGPAGRRQAAAGSEDGREELKVRLPVRAGSRMIGVTFVKRTSAYAEGLTRPFLRGRGPQPAVGAITISGPFAASGVSDTPARRRIFVCMPATASEEEPCARKVISTLVRRAYRRPSVAADVDALMPFYLEGHAERGFEAGIQRVVERALVSPEFLFRIEDGPRNIAAGTPYAISDVELASRLSFFLWSSIPDDELLDLAVAGSLRKPGVLDQQVKRMLADSRSDALVTNFAAQWLFLRDLQARRPNDRFFPDFDEGLRQALSRETELFFGSIVRENRPILELLSANYTFVNERLARHYGIPHVYGSDFRKITLPEGSVRGGLLGHASLLTLTSYATRTSPVVRGKWILENIVGTPPPPPPPNVPALKAETADGKTLSMRERMAQHSNNPICASCHRRMDPLGFALENFDAIGRWRTEGESGKPIDASGALPDGTKFDGIEGLRNVLMKRPDRFVMTLTEKLLMYAVGRQPRYYDSPALRAIAREAALNDYRFSSIVLGIVKSMPFQMRRSES